LLGIFYFFHDLSSIDTTLLVLILLFLLLFSGYVITKLSVDPLALHVENLQNLSKETLHELNLPISTIMTNIHMLKKSLKDEKDLKRIQRIQSACDMLQERYNELDYMIKLQSANVVYEDFELDELVKQRVEFLQTIYPHVEFNMKLNSTHITNDKVGLSKVIDNLIDNGVKYSSNIYKINILLDNHTLEIQDFGKGMDEVEILQVFDNYYQSNKEMRGFGIGLSMVKRFCDKNKILLNIKSKPNSGTTVSLKFKQNKEI
jgi:signal transduction histidine kinase